MKQGGTRRGANMGILNHDHPDVMKFIRAKADGDYLNNFNISIAVTNSFIEQAKKKQDYNLGEPKDRSNNRAAQRRESPRHNDRASLGHRRPRNGFS